MMLEYDSEGFASRARKLLSAGQAFSVTFRGKAGEALRKQLERGQIDDFALLMKERDIKLMVGILALAKGLERQFTFEQLSDTVVFRVVGDDDSE